MRDGFTIVEVLLALLLMTFMVLGFQAATGEIIHYSAQSDRHSVASQLVEDRLELIRIDPVYDSLRTRYDGSEPTIAGHPGLVRSTVVRRTQETLATGVRDYAKVTVTVTGEGLRGPLARTIVIAAP